MNQVAEQVVILVAMMLVGFIASKAKIITPDGRSVLTRLVLYVTQPFLVINSFQMDYSVDLARNMAIVALIAALTMGASYLLGMIMWPRSDDGKRRILWQATVFSNCGFMGIPVMQSLFGEAGVIYVSVYVLVFTVFVWTAGVYICAGKTGTWKEIFLQPGLIAVVIGILMFAFGWKLPQWAATKLANGIGSLTTPLAMMIVGALMAEGDIRHALREWTVFAAAAVRLFLLPALVLGVMWLAWHFGLPGMPAVDSSAFVTCVLLAAMPVAANVAIFASMYSIKPQYASHMVLVSTLFSMVTVPLWMFVMHALAGG